MSGGMSAQPGGSAPHPLWIGPPPTHSNQPPPAELEQMLHIARKFDVAKRDARNRAMPRAATAPGWIFPWVGDVGSG